MNKQQARAVTPGIIGLALILIKEPLIQALTGSVPDRVMAALYLLGPIGLVFLVIAIYRLCSKGPTA
jgi:hypothetical protein